MDASTVTSPLWWQKGIIYHIYPRSFMDANGDGIGDLPGMVRQLDYCRWLGVHAIWLSPIYPSPMADFGYDVSDYTAIHPLFGTLSDFDVLLREAHRLDLKVLLDYVPNHTSAQHPWFLQSRSSRDNPYRDWYLWHDPAPAGGPPNNWRSVFGGSAWEWDKNTGQYFLHSFLKEQADLNWRNPAVRHAMAQVLRFWLQRGVDGFRVDAVSRVIKDAALRDDPPNPDYTPDRDPYYQLLPTYSRDQPEMGEVISYVRQVVAEYGERMLIGEAYLPLPRLLSYYEAGIDFPFNFQLLQAAWKPAVVGSIIDTYEATLTPAQWPNWVLGNHDRSRLASRIGREQTPVAALLLLTLRGTPTLYYGDEIGMCNVPIPSDLTQDPWEKNVPGRGLGRDPERTPMQWSAAPQAGFTTGSPWLPVAEDFPQVNVAQQRNNPRSLLSLYRRVIQLRTAEPALHAGSYAPVWRDERVLVYTRARAGKQFLIALNFSAEPATFTHAKVAGRICLSTLLDREGEHVMSTVALRGNEGVIIEG
jgi:alpha-glucosidase